MTRSDDDRPAILALRANAGKVTRSAGLHVVPDGAVWIPPQDPHRATITALATELMDGR